MLAFGRATHYSSPTRTIFLRLRFPNSGNIKSYLSATIPRTVNILKTILAHIFRRIATIIINPPKNQIYFLDVMLLLPIASIITCAARVPRFSMQ